MNCKCYHAERNFLGKIGVCWGTKECEACTCGGEESKCDFYDYVRERASVRTIDMARGDYKLLSFGQAIERLKQGERMKRTGWNGKDQYIELAKNISYVNARDEIVNAEHDAIGNQAIAFVGTSGVQLGWLASQADMLAEDWMEYAGPADHQKEA